MKQVTIAASIGPASMRYDVLKQMAVNGASIFRVNLSYVTQEQFEFLFNSVKQINKETNLHPSTLIDTRGPEIRIGKLSAPNINFDENQIVYFLQADSSEVANVVPIATKDILQSINLQHTIIAVNNTRFEVIEVKDDIVVTRVVTGGVMHSGIKIIIPNASLQIPYLNQNDYNDIVYALENNVNYIALSFVNSAKNVLEVKDIVKKHNSSAKIIAKIESNLGYNNLEEIAQVADGIMIARGDLGTEVGFENVPHIQNQIISHCTKLGVHVMLATDILGTMQKSSTPTRAEVHDLATAVLSGVNSVLFTGETTTGVHPALVISVAKKIIDETLKHA